MDSILAHRKQTPRPEAAEPLRDAIARFVPGLAVEAEAGAIGLVLERLAWVLESGDESGMDAATDARSSIELYAAGDGVDEPEVEALRTRWSRWGGGAGLPRPYLCEVSGSRHDGRARGRAPPHLLTRSNACRSTSSRSPCCTSC